MLTVKFLGVLDDLREGLDEDARRGKGFRHRTQQQRMVKKPAPSFKTRLVSGEPFGKPAERVGTLAQARPVPFAPRRLHAFQCPPFADQKKRRWRHYRREQRSSMRCAKSEFALGAWKAAQVRLSVLLGCRGL
jgi:hypothetical protein